ncbi:DEAD-box type RNA helicase [Serendipita sp. 399]|nr:DEAD-box type RNA helicase [Serendipita sp. 399]
MTSNINESFDEARISYVIGRLKAGEGPKGILEENALFERFLDPKMNPQATHWYCQRASTLLHDVATYSQAWLVASDPQRVARWKELHATLMDTCPDCVKSMEDALLESQFTPDKVTAFIKLHVEWNVERISQHLQRLPPTATLNDLPAAVSYHIFYSPSILSHSKIWFTACSKLPSGRIKNWPTAFPAGLILLLCQSDTLFRWSSAQIDAKELSPLPDEIAPRDSHRQRALKGMLVALANSAGESVSLSDQSPLSQAFEGVPSFRLWTRILAIPHLFLALSQTQASVPSEQGKNYSLIGVIVAQLSRNDKVLGPVLQAFESLVRQYSSRTWADQPKNLPIVALSALKDNKHLLSTALSSMVSKVKWIQPFLESVTGSSVFSDVLHQMFQMFAQEAQHQQRDENRPVMFAQFLTALEEAHKLPPVGGVDHKQVIVEATNIHIDMVIAVAFEGSFDQEYWSTARMQTRHFLAELLKHDVRQIQAAIIHISGTEGTCGDILRNISSSYASLWSRLRNALRPNDLDGYAFFIDLVSYASQLSLVKPLEDKNEKKTTIQLTYIKLEEMVENIHTGFDDCMLKLSNAIDGSVLAAMTTQEDVASNLIPLFISPSASLVEGAQTLLIQTHNADSRPESFRALLENQFDGSIKGMIGHLQTVLSIITKSPAISVAKTLVICYSDVLEALCSRGSGLLFDQTFKSRKSQLTELLPLLWKYMCILVGQIIARTPDWSQLFNAKDMTPWMNEALIFSAKLVEQRNVFESAIFDAQGTKQVGSKGDLVMDLTGTLSPLLSWLRLTNPELLDRSYEIFLMVIDAFQKTGRMPEQKIMDKIKSTIQKWSNASTIVSEGRPKFTHLSQDRLGTLLKRLGQLEGEDDSDVEFISQSFSPRKSTQQPAKPLQQSSISSFDTFATKRPEKTVAPKSQVSEDTKMVVPPVARRPFHGAGLDKKMVQRAIQERKEAEAAKNRIIKPTTKMRPSSPSSSEGESDDEGVVSLSELGKVSAVARPKERRTAILLNGLGGSTSATAMSKQPQQVHKYQTRFIPDLTPLHRIILSWDYDHIGPEPPTVDGPLKLKTVPETFTSHRHYLDVFHPLLILECWNSLVKSKEERLEKVICTLTGKMHADFWVELDVAVQASVSSNWSLAETDILLMEHTSGQRRLAKVHSVRQTKQGSQITLRYSSEVARPEFERVSVVQSEWSLSKIFSLSTIHREYAALMGMGTYECAEAVLRAQINTPIVPSDSDVRRAMEAHRLNYPQARAVLSSMKTRGFSLIQGPPGTGKTSTICGLVGAFLSSRKSASVAVAVGKPTQKPVPRKVLVCAPSNAAIDEVTKRIKDGVWNSDGRKILPEVVRLGSINSINVSVRDASLDQLIEDRLSKTSAGKADDSSSEIATLRNELARVKQLRQEKLEEAQKSKNNAARSLELDKELRELTSRRIQLSSRLTMAQDKGKEVARTMDSARRKARSDVLNDADVICCTLSGSGHETIEQLDFDLVIIDEAAQAIELSSLIPLKFSSDRCVMVGDPQQLPPTVISQTATKHRYNQSIQYRMHPEISRLPSTLFYGGKLQDGPEMALKTAQPWHKSTELGIYRFFDVSGTEIQADLGYSQWNQAEVSAAVSLYQKFRLDYPNLDLDYRVGIISMYRAQLAKLREAFASRFGRDVLTKIDFNTVDGFQGQEKDIIILSCVRAGVNVTSIGFLSDFRRMNVAITRSRSSLYILGHAATLKRSDSLWERIVSDAEDRGVLVQVNGSTFQRSVPQEVKLPSTSITEAKPGINGLKASRLAPTSSNGEKLPSMPHALPTAPRAWRSLEGMSVQAVNATARYPSSETTSMAASAGLDVKPSSVIPLKRQKPTHDDGKRNPPALRHTPETNNAPPEITPNAAPLRPIARYRPPKPPGSNLFIPKKPVVKPPRLPNNS